MFSQGFGGRYRSDTIGLTSPPKRLKAVHQMKNQRNIFRIPKKAVALVCLAFSTFLFTINNASSNDFKMKIESAPYGKTTDGNSVTLYTLTNSLGNTVQMIDYGAIVVSINVPDRSGNKTNVTAGFPSLDGYLQRHPYFGSTVGRFCNRIAKGGFSIKGKPYSLAINNGPNHLHGGVIGFDKLMWSAVQVKSESSVGLVFSLVSPDMQEGYPGNLRVSAEYNWDNDNKLSIRFNATTDQATHLNLTNHAYFNLSGAKSGTIYKHELSLPCSKFLPVDENMIPTGVLSSVANTPLDFTGKRLLGDRIADLKETKGYDHCYVVDGPAGKLRAAGFVKDPASGRTMEVMTTQPGIQLYTGNFLSGEADNSGFKQHEAFCLETQHFPDSPNQPSFPSTLLEPGQKFDETTTYKFGVSN